MHRKYADTKHMMHLDRLAELAIKVGVNIKRGQELVVTAPVEALPLVRLVAKHAYTQGASAVTPIFSDEQSMIIRFKYAPAKSFDKGPHWLAEGLTTAFCRGAARLSIVGGDPFLLSAQDRSKLHRLMRVRTAALAPALRLMTEFTVNWTMVPYATPAWARAVFPHHTERVALSKLWKAIFACCRIGKSDVIGHWNRHAAELETRAKRLNGKRYKKLHFRGPGTDLHVGLLDAHEWIGGRIPAKNRITCVPNIPTEEIFTVPHRDRTEGIVSSTRAFSYEGTVVEGLVVRFDRGKVATVAAKKGLHTLRQILNIDSGAKRLGEVALVPASSPIAKTGTYFFNTLFDENAASHLAFGQSVNWLSSRSGDEVGSKLPGANSSSIHVDWMIGSKEIDVDGTAQNQNIEPIMRNGEWVI
jgi:aminopeptidase